MFFQDPDCVQNDRRVLCIQRIQRQQAMLRDSLKAALQRWLIQWHDEETRSRQPNELSYTLYDLSFSKAANAARQPVNPWAKCACGLILRSWDGFFAAVRCLRATAVSGTIKFAARTVA